MNKGTSKKKSWKAGSYAFKQSTLMGSPKDILNDIIAKYPNIHKLKEKRELGKQEIRDLLLENKKYELERLHIKRMYKEEDITITPEELMNKPIEIKKFESDRQYIQEYAKTSLNTAQMVPGAKPYQITCNKKKIGILTFSNVLLSCKPRNEIFPEELDFQKGNNLQVCISYPWSGRYMIGKLGATLACTMTRIQKKNYMETTSLFGKSIQYDRLPFLRFIGLTTGKFGAKYLFPHIFFNEIRDKMRNFINHPQLEGPTYHDRKKHRLSIFLKISGLQDQGYKAHNLSMKRGYYICRLHKSFKKFEENRLPPNSIEEAIKYWRERWLIKRMPKPDIKPKRKLRGIEKWLYT